jgi:hypothetical protein
MIKFRYLAIATIAAAGCASGAFAQAGVPTQGTGNGAAAANNYREETASYNGVIGKVGTDPVRTEKAKRAAQLKASGKVRFPLIGFGKDRQGLLINLTTQELLARLEKTAKGG